MFLIKPCGLLSFILSNFLSSLMNAASTYSGLTYLKTNTNFACSNRKELVPWRSIKFLALSVHNDCKKVNLSTGIWRLLLPIAVRKSSNQWFHYSGLPSNFCSFISGNLTPFKLYSMPVVG